MPKDRLHEDLLMFNDETKRFAAAYLCLLRQQDGSKSRFAGSANIVSSIRRMSNEKVLQVHYLKYVFLLPILSKKRASERAAERKVCGMKNLILKRQFNEPRKKISS